MSAVIAPVSVGPAPLWWSRGVGAGRLFTRPEFRVERLTYRS